MTGGTGPGGGAPRPGGGAPDPGGGALGPGGGPGRRARALGRALREEVFGGLRRIGRPVGVALSYRENWIRLGALVTGIVTGVALTVLTTQGSPWSKGDAPVGDRAELVVLAGQDPSHARQDRIDAWNAMVTEWNADPAHHDRRKPFARVVWLPSAADEQLGEMLRRAQSPRPDVDVLVLDAPWTRQFAAQGYIRRLGVDVDTSEFLAKPLRTCRFGDGLYALPFNTDAGLLFSWNASVPGGTAEPGPADWTALRAAAARSGPGRSAFAGQFGPGETFVVNVLEGVLARGGKILDADGHLHLDGPGVAEALRALSRDLGDPAAIVGRAEELDETSSRDAFVRHEAVYLRDWPAYAPRATDGGLDPRVAVRPLPWPSVLGGQNLAVAAESPRPRAAQELVEWLTGEASQLRLFEDGGFAATRRVLYLDPKISQSERYRYAQGLLQAIDQALPRPSAPNYQLFSQVFEQVMRRVLAEGGQLRDDDVDQITAAVEGRVKSGAQPAP